MWPDSQAPANWVNPKTGWTYNLAEQAADQLNSRKSELHQNDIWLDMSLNTIGIPNAHLKPSRAINKTIAANNIRQWYEDYFCRLQAL
jgi:hypothetical protein